MSSITAPAPDEQIALWLCGCDAPIDIAQVREYRHRGLLREVHTVCPRHGLTTLARIYPIRAPRR